jgi:uncharacterized protein YbjT (DUF2867 family)
VTVVVYGASGWTGSQVARALHSRGIPLVLAGRSADKLAQLNDTLDRSAAIRVAIAGDSNELERALAGANVVVNCAGPFVDSGLEIVNAAMRVGAHYLDVSGEESHVARVYELHEAAAARGVSVCPAFAGKGALGDLGAEVAATPQLHARGIDEVAVAYAHGLREATRPSLASILAIAGQGVFQRGNAEAARSLVARSFGFPPPFDRGLALRVPAAETISIPRHLRARRVVGFISLAPGHPVNEPWARLCAAAAPAIPLFARVLFSEWGRFHLRLYLPPPERADREDSFAVSIEVQAGDQSARLAMIARDAYGITAEVVALAVTRILFGPRPRAGVLAPSELCAPAATLDHLQRSGAISIFRPRATPAQARTQGWS